MRAVYLSSILLLSREEITCMLFPLRRACQFFLFLVIVLPFFLAYSHQIRALSRRTVKVPVLSHDGQWGSCSSFTMDSERPADFSRRTVGGALALVFTTAAMVTVVSRTGCGRPLFGVRKIEFRWVGARFFFLFLWCGDPLSLVFFPSMCMPVARGVLWVRFMAFFPWWYPGGTDSLGRFDLEGGSV